MSRLLTFVLSSNLKDARELLAARMLHNSPLSEESLTKERAQEITSEFTSGDVSVLTHVQRKLKVLVDRIRRENSAFSSYFNELNGQLGREQAMRSKRKLRQMSISFQIRDNVSKVYRRIAAIHVAQERREKEAEAKAISEDPVLARPLMARKRSRPTLLRNNTVVELLSGKDLSLDEQLKAQLTEFRKIWSDVGVRIEQSSFVVKGALRRGFFWIRDLLHRMESQLISKSAKIVELQRSNVKLEKQAENLRVQLDNRAKRRNVDVQTNETTFAILQYRSKTHLAVQTLESMLTRPLKSDDTQLYRLVGTVSPRVSPRDAGVGGGAKSTASTPRTARSPVPSVSPPSLSPGLEAAVLRGFLPQVTYGKPAVVNSKPLSSTPVLPPIDTKEDTSSRNLPTLRRQGTMPSRLTVMSPTGSAKDSFSPKSRSPTSFADAVSATRAPMSRSPSVVRFRVPDAPFEVSPFTVAPSGSSSQQPSRSASPVSVSRSDSPTSPVARHSPSVSFAGSVQETSLPVASVAVDAPSGE
jgi:hypothetical protein